MEKSDHTEFFEKIATKKMKMKKYNKKSNSKSKNELTNDKNDPISDKITVWYFFEML